MGIACPSHPVSEKEEGRLRIPICILGEELDDGGSSCRLRCMDGTDGMATTNDQDEDGEEEEDG